MTTLATMLSILELFTPERPLLTSDQIISALKCTRPTGYRYIRELSHAGLINRLGSTYTLGSRIIELDYNIRAFDPLLAVGRPVLEGLKSTFLCDAFLMVFIGGKMTVTHHAPGLEVIPVSYGRGRSLPLFRGSGSKVIVANLPSAEQKRLFERRPEEVVQSNLGDTWSDFRRSLLDIRQAGYAVSHGELDSGLVGLAIPISLQSGPPASIVLAFSAARFALLNLAVVIEILTAAKSQIEGLMKQEQLAAGPAPQTGVA
jgi:DNA-binding IclR family transcriptional regulator